MQFLRPYLDTVAKNGIANVINGTANWLPLVLIPFLMTRTYTANDISVWAIAVQLVSYITFLALGVQTAMGRFVASLSGTRDAELADVVVTAFRYLRIASVAGAFGIAIFVLLMSRIYPEAPQGSATIVVLIAFTGCLQLINAGYSAIFIGDQRNEFPAIVNSVYRALQLLALFVAIDGQQQLDVLAAIYLVTTVAGSALHFLTFRKWGGPSRFSSGKANKAAASKLWLFCYPMIVWQFGVLMITGTDLFIISWLDFEFGASFAIASSLTMAIAGFLGALSTPLIQSSAALHAQGKTDDVLRQLRRYTVFYVAMALAIYVGVQFVADTLIEFVYGPEFADSVTRFFSVLTIAVVIRAIGAPYVAVVLGYDMQKKILLSPVVEGVANVFFSLVLGLQYGVYGVVWGSVVGAIIGMSFHILYNMRKTKPISLWSKLRVE